jgi:hypothetical protein
LDRSEFVESSWKLMRIWIRMWEKLSKIWPFTEWIWVCSSIVIESVSSICFSSHHFRSTVITNQQ